MSRLATAAIFVCFCGVADGQTDPVAYPTEMEAGVGGAVLGMLNAARAEAGMGELEGHADLDLLAYQHSREMAARGVVTHHSFLHGVGTETRLKLAFPRVMQFGENVARNRGAEALHAALQVSEGHRLNRMDPAFTHVGLGAVRVDDFQIYLTEIFVRVLDPALIDGIETLYTEMPPESLPEDEPHHGSVSGTTVRVGAPLPDNPAYWTYRGITAYLDERYADAIDDFEKALDLSPDYRYARYDLARALIANDQPAAAVEVLADHLSRVPEDLDAWMTRGTAALLLQDYGPAERAFRHVIERRSRDAGAWYNLGLSLEMQHQLTEAERAYRQSLHLDNTSEAAVVALARVRR